MDCKELLELIQLYLDGEATPQQENTLMAHVNGCSNCRCIYEFEHAFKSYVQKRLANESVPESSLVDLKAKIDQALKIC